MLEELLGKAGCTYTVAEVRAEFEASLEEDPETPPAQILPLLFETEPRFSGPDEARRLYGNLLGLWDLVAARAGGGALPVLGDAPAGPPPLPEAPEGAAEGPEVPADYVHRVRLELLEGDRHQRGRAEDRLENRQADLVAFVRDALAECSPTAEEVALGLLTITHEAMLRAFGPKRVGAARHADLSAAMEAPADANAEPAQPALDALFEESLDDAVSAPDDPLPEADRAPLSRVLRAAEVALTRALR